MYRYITYIQYVHIYIYTLVFVAGGSNGVGLEIVKQLTQLGTPVHALVRRQVSYDDDNDDDSNNGDDNDEDDDDDEDDTDNYDDEDSDDDKN
jgi:NAD(P)-dependent dehydrogenase (short-subunit alcohol dehydrogenase family)